MEENNKNIPIGVKIISILTILGGLLCIILGVLFLIGLKFQTPLGSIITGAGIILLIGGILISFLGFMLWKGKNWAREVVIFFSVLGIVGSIINLIRGDYYYLINLAIEGTISGYLWFNKDVKEFFVKKI